MGWLQHAVTGKRAADRLALFLAGPLSDPFASVVGHPRTEKCSLLGMGLASVWTFTILPLLSSTGVTWASYTCWYRHHHYSNGHGSTGFG
jgi:hypothetical protein